MISNEMIGVLSRDEALRMAEEEVMGKAAYIQAFHADDLKNFEA